jgi:hypothetical protein
MDGSNFGGLIYILVIFLLVLSFVWCFLPFAIFGTKPRLDKLVEESEKTNMWIQELTVEIKLLRQELAKDKQPVSRHITFNHEEKRDVVP